MASNLPISVIYAFKRLEETISEISKPTNSVFGTKTACSSAAALSSALAELAGAKPPLVDAARTLEEPAVSRTKNAIEELPAALPEDSAFQLACALALPAETAASALAHLLRAQHARAASRRSNSSAEPKELSKEQKMQEDAAAEALASTAASLIAASSVAIPKNAPRARIPPPLAALLIIQVPHIVSSHIRINNSNKDSKETQKSNEPLQLAVVRLISAIFSAEIAVRQLIGNQKVPHNFLLDLNAPVVQPTLAHLATVLLDFVSSKTNLSLRIMAVDALESMLILISDPDRVAQILPGIVSALARVVLASDHVPSKLIVRCLETIANGIVISTSDSNCADFLPESTQSAAQIIALLGAAAKKESIEPHHDNHETNAPVSAGEFRRSAKWLAETGTRIAAIANRLCMLRRHDHPSVRKSVLEFASKISSSCARTLSTCLSVLVDTIVHIEFADAKNHENNTDQQNVNPICERIRNRLGVSENAWPSVSLRLLDRLGELLDQFPKRMRSVDESVVLETLGLVTAYIDLLASQSETTINQHASHLVQGFVNLLEFDSGGVHAVEKRHSSAGAALVQMEPCGSSLLNIDSDCTTIAAPTRRLASYRNPQILDYARLLCRVVAQYTSADVLVDEFLPLLSDPATQAQASFVLGELCLGVNLKSKIDKPFSLHDASLMLQSVAAELLALPVLSMPTNVQDTRLFHETTRSGLPYHFVGGQTESVPTVAEMSHRILNTSLVLESLGRIASALPSDQATLVLMDGLYVLLEKLGDRNYAISDAAAWALMQFAQSCGVNASANLRLQHHALATKSKSADPSVADLVLAHADYLIDSVSRRLRHVRHNPLAPKVLTAAIRVVGYDIVGPLTADCVELVLDVLEDLGTTGQGTQLELQSSLHGNENDNVASRFDISKPKTSPLLSSATHSDEPGLARELISVLYALMEVISRHHHNQMLAKTHPTQNAGLLSTTQSDSATNQTDANVNDVLGIPDCSHEMRVYFLEHKKDADQGCSDDDSDGVSAKEFFEKRIRESDFNKESPVESLEDAPSLKEIELPPATPAQSATLQILSKVIHFLGSDVPLIRARVLEMFRMGIPVLVDRAGELNPLVHALWPRLMRRCQDTHHFVAIEAIEAVGVVASVTPDFVRKRVADDVVPRVVQVLKKLQDEVMDAFVASQSISKDVKKSKFETMQVSDVGKTNSNMNVANTHFISDTIDTNAVRNRLFVACIDMASMLILHVDLNRRDQDQLAGVLFGMLNAKLFSSVVQDKAVLLLSRLASVKTGGDWVWAMAWMASGANRLDLLVGNTCDASDRLCLRAMTICDAVCDAYLPKLVNLADYAENVSKVLMACKSPLFETYSSLPKCWNSLDEGIGKWTHKMASDSCA